MSKTIDEVTGKIKQELEEGKGSKRYKIKTLLKHFGFKKRSEDNTSMITEILSNENISINPSLIRLGEQWELTPEDWIYLSVKDEQPKSDLKQLKFKPASDWKKDEWFESVMVKKFRTEREVETKFIIPLLGKLGFIEDDRYDAMIVNAAHGSRQTCLEVDFAIFNSTSPNLKNQPLLVAEAKKEERLKKEVELQNAQRQVKSYSLWLSCHFGLITDSNRIQVLDLIPSFNGIEILFDCKRENLKEHFAELYNLISKDALTHYYESKKK